MKTNLFSFLLSSICFSLSASPLNQQDPTVDYQSQAHEWAEKVLSRVDCSFLPDLLALLHASYMRSYMTLIVQDDYLKLLNRVGSGWNHIIGTRLDPSKDSTFDISTIAIDTTVIQQFETFQKKCNAQQQYVELLNRLADDTHAHYPGKNSDTNYRPCRIMIDELRDNARTVVAESLIAVMDEIQQEIQKAQQAISQAAELFKSEGQLKNSNFLNRSISELLWYYVPHLMVKSFVNFDKGYTTASKQCFDAYVESQQIGNDIWHRLEIARAAYYAAHYCALFKQVCALDQELTKHVVAPETVIKQLVDYTCLT